MKKKICIALTAFFSVLLLGTLGLNVTVGYGAAPSWHPTDGDITEWDLRWEGSLNDTYVGLNISGMYNQANLPDAWGQIWSKNDTTNTTIEAAALVYLADLGINYWGYSIPGWIAELITAGAAGSFGVPAVNTSVSFWDLFVWFVNGTIMLTAPTYNVSEVSDPGYDHGLLINGTEPVFMTDIEILIATKGGGFLAALSFDLNLTIVQDLQAMGIANASEIVYEWLNNTYFFPAMVIMMVGFSNGLALFSGMIAILLQYLPLLSLLDLQVADATTQGNLTEITGDVAHQAGLKGFGYIAPPGGPPFIPGFGFLFVAVPIALIATIFFLNKRKRETSIP